MKWHFFLISFFFAFSLFSQNDLNKLVETYQKNSDEKTLNKILGQGMENHEALKTGPESTAELRKKLRAMIRAKRDRALLDKGLVVHEWGSMYKLQGQKKAIIYGIHEDQSDLPSFVQVWSPKPQVRPMIIKKPIIYFYSKERLVLNCTVGCKNGYITQWWPRSQHYFPNADIKVDLKNLHGNLTWRNVVVDKKTVSPLRVVKNHPWWGIARDTDANPIQVGGDAEKFIFYRAATEFQPSLKTQAVNDQTVKVTNESKVEIKNVLVVNVDKGKAMYKVIPKLAAGKSLTIKVNQRDTEVNATNVEKARAELQENLEEFGLFPKEAKGMTDIWKKDFFQDPGLRVFSLMPDYELQEMLPMTLSQKEVSRVRVLLVVNEFISQTIKDEINSLLSVITSGTLKERREKKAEIKAAEAKLQPMLRRYHSYATQLASKMEDPEKKFYLKEALSKVVFNKP